jgi:uncharacterized phage protein gp47/JayE
MALEETPGEILTKTRDQVRDQFTRDYQLRVPSADVGEGTQPYVDGSNVADATMLLYNDAVVIGRGTNLRTSAGTWLREIGEPEGIFARPAVGSSGFVEVVTSAGTWTILAGTELRDQKSRLRFKVLTTALYGNGALVPVTGIDKGPATNLDAGTILQFTAPPPGVSPSAEVAEASDGSGLSGGRDADDDAAYRRLIAARRADPPASGNDAEYQRAIQNVPGVAVEKAFTIPAILGPGTTAFVFTMRPSKLGASRVPNGAEIATVLEYVIGQEPADDGIFACSILEVPVVVALKVTWAKGAPSWVDVTPFPTYISGDKVLIDGAVAPTTTTVRLTTATSTTTPQVGQTIGFYDAANAVFRRKRISVVAVVVANKSWDIEVDTANNASDTSYAPVVGTAASPWSESLDALVGPVLGHFEEFGPGEQVASLPDPGRRQRRQPESPAVWPSVIGNRLIQPVLAATSYVADADLQEPTVPFATPVGTPGVLSKLLTLGDLCAFKQ